MDSSPGSMVKPVEYCAKADEHRTGNDGQADVVASNTADESMKRRRAFQRWGRMATTSDTSRSDQLDTAYGHIVSDDLAMHKT